MSVIKNTDPFMVWNSPEFKDDPLAPHNDPTRSGDFMEPWNDPSSSHDDLEPDDREYYGLAALDGENDGEDAGDD